MHAWPGRGGGTGHFLRCWKCPVPSCRGHYRTERSSKRAPFFSPLVSSNHRFPSCFCSFAFSRTACEQGPVLYRPLRLPLWRAMAPLLPHSFTYPFLSLLSGIPLDGCSPMGPSIYQWVDTWVVHSLGLYLAYEPSHTCLCTDVCLHLSWVNVLDWNCWVLWQV